jgi:hypothetical protein
MWAALRWRFLARHDAEPLAADEARSIAVTTRLPETTFRMFD